jgi:hypothetical protein
MMVFGCSGIRCFLVPGEGEARDFGLSFLVRLGFFHYLKRVKSGYLEVLHIFFTGHCTCPAFCNCNGVVSEFLRDGGGSINVTDDKAAIVLQDTINFIPGRLFIPGMVECTIRDDEIGDIIL